MHNSVKHTASLIKFRRILLATHKSAEKRDRQSIKRRERNIAAKSAIKTKIKSVLGAVETKDRQASAKALLAAIPALDKAAVKGVIHRKNASRKISRLTKKINALKG
jgi:small subunit ribosomal protein S20